MSIKEGTFEWIVRYEDIKKFFSEPYSKITGNVSDLKVLVIGCGTSTLSESLVSTSGFGEVVSIDNDLECIKHMQSRHLDNTRLQWHQYDIVEDRGKPQHNVLDSDGYFDVVVDKGTFDAIHVEGSISPMLAEIHRLLKLGGVYVLCSINSPLLLEPLLSIADLQLNVELHELDLSEYNVATVAVCTKLGNEAIDEVGLAAREKEVADRYFQSEHPLLTEQDEARIRQEFSHQLGEGVAAADGSLSVTDAHLILFGGLVALDCGLGEDLPSDLLAYSPELFEEDLSGFPLATAGRMTVEEALDFVRTMQ